jgi:DnaJ family protein C protein 13
LRCFSAAAQFPACRDVMAEQPAVAQDICRSMWFDGASTLTLAAIEACTSFAVDERLQNLLLRHGALWHLLLRLFKFVLIACFVCHLMS